MATNSRAKTATEESKTKQTQPEVDVKALMEQVAALQKKVAEMEAPPTTALEQTKDKMIKFINLTVGSVMLKGSAKRPYEIEGRYNSRKFTDTEAKIIVSNMGNYLREGFVFIDDAEFVREVGLADAYMDMLNPDELKALLNKNPDAIVSAYELALDGQKKIILDMIIEKKAKGEPVDANVLVRIGELSGKDLVHIEEEETE